MTTETQEPQNESRNAIDEAQQQLDQKLDEPSAPSFVTEEKAIALIDAQFASLRGNITEHAETRFNAVVTKNLSKLAKSIDAVRELVEVAQAKDVANMDSDERADHWERVAKQRASQPMEDTSTETEETPAPAVEPAVAMKRIMKKAGVGNLQLDYSYEEGNPSLEDYVSGLVGQVVKGLQPSKETSPAGKSTATDNPPVSSPPAGRTSFRGPEDVTDAWIKGEIEKEDWQQRMKVWPDYLRPKPEA